MKTSTVILLTFLVSFFCQAQTKFGFTAGMQFANVRIIDFNTDNRIGFNVGMTSLTPLSEGVDLNVQFVLSGKGYKFYDGTGYKNLVRPLYLELPVVIRVNLTSTKETKLFLGGGGYYAFGIGGDVIYYPNGYKETKSIVWGTDIDSDLNSSDVGLTFQFGAKFRENYEGQFFYDMGLKKIVPSTTSNSFNRVFGFNLTWYF